MSETSQLPAIKVDPFAVAVQRESPSGKVMGKRLSYVTGYKDGDVRKALRTRNPELKGKKLTAEVEAVKRGDIDVAWALERATADYARSQGWRPIITDLNNAGDKMVSRYEKVTVALTKESIVKELTEEELEAALAARRAAKNGRLEKTIEVGGTTTIDPEKGQL